MKAVFKTSTMSTPLELIAGLNINTYGSTPKKITANKITLCSDSDTNVDVYMQATNLADNSIVTRHFAYSIPLTSGDPVDVINGSFSFTSEYSLFVSKPIVDGASVDVYCEYTESDDNPFVVAFTT